MAEFTPEYSNKESSRHASNSERRPPNTAAMDQVIEAIPDATVVFEKDGTLIAWNERLEKLLGQAPKRGTSAVEFFSALESQGRSVSKLSSQLECLDTRVPGTEGMSNVSVKFKEITISETDFTIGTLREASSAPGGSRSEGEYREILETIEDGVYVLDESFEIEHVNSAICSITGYDREELIGESALLLADDDTIEEAVQMSEELLAGKRDVATMTTEIETASGHSLPIETRYSTYQHSSDGFKQVGVIRDISDQRQFEETLAALHQSTESLLQAEREEEISELIIDSVANIEEVSGAAVYQFDQSAGLLQLDETLAPLPEFLSGVSAINDTDNPLWQSFVNSESVVVDSEIAGPETAINTEGRCFCLGSYGVLYVTLTECHPRPEILETLNVVAANARTALGRVSYETALQSREEELARRNRSLTQLKELNSVIRAVSTSIMDASTQTEIEQAVCDLLVESDLLSFAWIGRQDGERLQPTAWAGEGGSYLDAVSMDLSGADNIPPAVRAATSDSVVTIDSTASDIRESDWRAAALANSFQSAISLPLAHESRSYGVLTVFGNEPAIYNTAVQSVCEELCDTVSRALANVDARQHRSSISGTQLELAVSVDTGPLQQLLGAVEKPLLCDGVVPGQDSTTRLFVSVECDRIPSLSHLEELNCVEDVHPIRGGDLDEDGTGAEQTLVEITLAGETRLDRLLDRDVRVKTLRFSTDASQMRASVVVPPTVSIRRLINRLNEEFNTVSLISKREGDVDERDWPVTRATIKKSLTERQFEVIQTAYYSGFYEMPRETNGQDLGARLDISQPTTSKHLRSSVQRILDLILDGSDED